MRLGVCFSSSFRVAHCLAWPGGDGEGAYRLRVCIHVPLAADFGPMEAWLEGLLLLLALAGPAGDLKNALLRRRLGSYVADCA